jgi:hypothetical protein
MLGWASARAGAGGDGLECLQVEPFSELGEQAYELSLVMRRQPREQLSEERAQALAHCVQCLASGRAQPDEHGAPVGPLAASLGETGGLEAVDEAGHGAGREAEPTSELVHAHVARGEHGEGLQLHGRDAAGDAPIEPGREPATEQQLRKFLPAHEKGVEQLVDLLFDSSFRSIRHREASVAITQLLLFSYSCY